MPTSATRRNSPSATGRAAPHAEVKQVALLWANNTTGPDVKRRHDLLHDKVTAVTAFFEACGKALDTVLPSDVKAWCCRLESQGLASATVYARVSRLSSFYEWLMREPQFAEQVHHNPVRQARPQAPKAYQTGRSEALDDASLRALLHVIKRRAEGGDLVGKRDYTLLLFFLLTGLRRHEVLSLRWGDLHIGETILVTTYVRGRDHVIIELIDPSARLALLDYLETSGRLAELCATSPLWTRHDHTESPAGALTSHAFAKNLKRYAVEAGIGTIHLHQMRHTFARIVGELAANVVEVQDALGHKHLSTTRVYLQRISVKRDRFGPAIAARLDLGV